MTIMTLSSIGSATTTPAGTTAGSSAAGTSATAQAQATSTQQPSTQQPPTQDASTRVTLSTLSGQAGIVATLNHGESGFQTYDATGLLDAVARAGNAAAGAAAPPSTAPAPSSGQDSPDTSVADGTSVSAAVPGDWGTILKANPALTSVAVADAVAQGIVNTINVYV